MGGDGTRADLDRRREREQRPAQLRWIAQARGLAAALDALPNALLLVTGGVPVRIWHANLTARRVLGPGGPLSLEDDRLIGATPDATRRLDAMLHRALQYAAGHRHECTLPPDGEGPLLTFWVETLDFGASRDLPLNRLALVEVAPPPPADLVLPGLCRDFGLTRGEAETALRLYATGSVAGIAVQARRSVHTIRTQLKAAMSKTSTHSQAGLVALVGNRLAGHPLPLVPSTPRGR
jgi:DNA-binding CsgD family transcriptional regulator